MKKTTTLLGAVISGATLAVAGLVALPSTAHAASSVSGSELEVRYGSYAHSGTGCTGSNSNGSDSGPVTAGTPSTRTISGSTSVTAQSGATTVIKHAATGTASYTLRDDRLATLDLRASGRTELTADQFQTCGASGWSQADYELRFTIDRPQWVTVTSSLSAQSGLWAGGETTTGEYRSFGFDSYTSGGQVSGTWYLLPGTYDMGAGIYWTHENEAEKQPERGNVRAGSGSVHIELYDAGSARTAVVGSGRKYVALGSQLACSTGSVPAGFGGNAAKVRTATFYVDGRKVRTVQKPKAGSRYTVPGIGATRSSTVKVRLVVDPPGRKRTAVVVASRGYRACEHR